MKVIFLDVDGVLNNDESLMLDDSLDETLLLRLRDLIKRTNANIILSSSWRLCFKPLCSIMSRLEKIGLHISGMTPNGVSLEWLAQRGIKPTNRYLDSYTNWEGKTTKITTDRGAEIMKWLSENEVESFVILDDEDFDIQKYYPNNFIKTKFKTGLTQADVNRAAKILGE